MLDHIFTLSDPDLDGFHEANADIDLLSANLLDKVRLLFDAAIGTTTTGIAAG